VVQFENILTPEVIDRLYKEAKKEVALKKKVRKILDKYPIPSTVEPKKAIPVASKPHLHHPRNPSYLHASNKPDGFQ
jgi:hypothetical protein